MRRLRATFDAKPRNCYNRDQSAQPFCAASVQAPFASGLPNGIAQLLASFLVFSSHHLVTAHNVASVAAAAGHNEIVT